MMFLSESEWLLWGGIGTMASAVMLALICLVVFNVTGKRIKKKLEKEYGKPWK